MAKKTKYIMTIVFESNLPQAEVETHFQNTVCAFEAKQRINIAHIKSVTGSEERPTLTALQQLLPEDFSSWDRLTQRSEPVKVDAKAGERVIMTTDNHKEYGKIFKVLEYTVIVLLDPQHGDNVRLTYMKSDLKRNHEYNGGRGCWMVRNQ